MQIVCILSTRSSFALWICPVFLSQRPTATAATSWVDWRATSWCPLRRFQLASLIFDLTPLLPLENVLPPCLEQPKTTFPYHSSPSSLLIWPVLLFTNPVLSAIHFSGISQHFKSASSPLSSPSHLLQILTVVIFMSLGRRGWCVYLLLIQSQGDFLLEFSPSWSPSLGQVHLSLKIHHIRTKLNIPTMNRSVYTMGMACTF